MTPERKFNSIVLSMMVAILFTSIGLLVPVLSNFSASGKVAALFVGALASAGTYRLITQMVSTVLRHNKYLKKVVLGPSYMEGTWVGHFIGHNDDIRYVVEIFEQELDYLVIRGYSFSEDGTRHAQWLSDALHIDSIKGRITYTYTCDVLSMGSPHQGIGVFDVQRENSRAHPTGIHGYVAEVTDGIRLPVKEIKMSESLLSPDAGLVGARKVPLDLPS